MERIALHNNRGVSLIEVLISLLILMVVSLATMRMALVGMSTNLQNSMRDEAVNVVELRMNELRNKKFDLISLGTVTETDISRTFRGASVPYKPKLKVDQVGADTSTKQITMSVDWTYKGTNYTHSATTIVRKQ